MLKKSLIIISTSYLATKGKNYCSDEPLLSMILRGEYENRIRRYSPPQKIFDVFSTIHETGRHYMTLQDLLKAICFYNYSLSDPKQTEGYQPEHILKFLGKHTRFQIYDYFILARFLACERQKIINYFQNHGLKEMNKVQFIQFMKDEVCKDYKDYIKQSFFLESRAFNPSAKIYEEKIAMIAAQLYGETRQKYSLWELIKFRRCMINELYEFEFLMFPITNGHIDGVDFARSIVKYVDVTKSRKFMKRVNKMKQFQSVKIDKNSYIGFHTYLQTNIHQLQKVLNKKGAISSKQFTHLINRFVKEKYRIKKEQVDIIVKLLDHDESGFLEKREVLGVLKNLQYYTSVKPGQLTLFESMKQDFKKVYDRIFRIIEVINE